MVSERSRLIALIDALLVPSAVSSDVLIHIAFAARRASQSAPPDETLGLAEIGEVFGAIASQVPPGQSSVSETHNLREAAEASLNLLRDTNNVTAFSTLAGINARHRRPD